MLFKAPITMPLILRLRGDTSMAKSLNIDF